MTVTDTPMAVAIVDDDPLSIDFLAMHLRAAGHEPLIARDAQEAGVDGVLIVDLPPEEEPALWDGFRARGLDTIAMVSPTTDPGRLPTIARPSRAQVRCRSGPCRRARSSIRGRSASSSARAST